LKPDVLKPDILKPDVWKPDVLWVRCTFILRGLYLEYVDEDEPEDCGAAGEKADGVGKQATHISLSLNYTLVISPLEALLYALICAVIFKQCMGG
jgi:hypothetical protein